MADRTNFVLKTPKKGERKSFSILKKTISESDTQYRKVESEALDAINQSLLSGIQDQPTCEIQAKEVMKSLYEMEARKKPKIVHNSENLELVT